MIPGLADSNSGSRQHRRRPAPCQHYPGLGVRAQRAVATGRGSCRCESQQAAGALGRLLGPGTGREPIRRRRQWPQRPPASRLPCMADGRCDQDGRQSGGSCTSIGAQAAYRHGPTHPGKQQIELIDSRYNLSSINRIQSVKTIQVAAFAHFPPRRSACACGHDLLDLSGPSGPCRLAMPARTNAAMFRYSVNRRCAVRATARALSLARACANRRFAVRHVRALSRRSFTPPGHEPLQYK